MYHPDLIKNASLRSVFCDGNGQVDSFFFVQVELDSTQVTDLENTAPTLLSEFHPPLFDDTYCALIRAGLPHLGRSAKALKLNLLL